MAIPAARLLGTALAGVVGEDRLLARAKSAPPARASRPAASQGGRQVRGGGSVAFGGGRALGDGAGFGPAPRGRGASRRASPYDLPEEEEAPVEWWPRYDFHPNEPRWRHDAFQGPLASRSAIFLRNLPSGITEQELAELFGSVGQIASVEVEDGPLPTATIGYVRQDVAQEAERRFHGRWLLGHELKVQAVREYQLNISTDGGNEDSWRQEWEEMQRHGYRGWSLPQKGGRKGGPVGGKGGGKGRRGREAWSLDRLL